MKGFTPKQVFILVLAIVAGIAFMETSFPVWGDDSDELHFKYKISI